ncbi:MAG: carboxypeptidase regulatory-like domain-containing protein [Candidatus Acidiferrum sp.]|jgi:hypothetical protein
MRVVTMGGVAAVLACGLVWVQAEQAPGGAGKAQAVVIVVKDQSGAMVAGAQVRVAPVAENPPEKMETDEHGELKLQLRPGGHGVIVRDPGFAMLRAHIEVKADAAAQIFPVVLQIASTGGPTVVGMKPEAGVLALTVVPFDEKFRITPEELKGMTRKTVTVHNSHANADETYEGVELADLLLRYGAPMGKELRGAALGYYVVVTGADGYEAVFSLAELDPSFHPGDVLVVDAMNGKALDVRTGPLRLVSTEDKRPARGVRNLVALEVKGK